MSDQKKNTMTVWLEQNGVTEAQWNTAMTSLFPGANPASVRLYFNYCQSRKLDPMKKPAHIVPMNVKNAATGQYEWRDVVMPGIYEYRTTAARTGLYAGQDDVVYGPDVEFTGGVGNKKTYTVPEFAKVTVRRIVQGHICEFTGTAYFSETCATKKDGDLNAMWSKRPRGQLAKCAEADALRKAFPDELGGEMTIEEMEGKQIDDVTVVSAPKYSEEQWDEFHRLIDGTNPLGYFVFRSQFDIESGIAIDGAYKATLKDGTKMKEMKRLDELYAEGREIAKRQLESFELSEDQSQIQEEWESLTDVEREYMLDNLNPVGLKNVQQLDEAA